MNNYKLVIIIFQFDVFNNREALAYNLHHIKQSRDQKLENHYPKVSFDEIWLKLGDHEYTDITVYWIIPGRLSRQINFFTPLFMLIYANQRQNDASDLLFSPKQAQLLFRQLQKSSVKYMAVFFLSAIRTEKQNVECHMVLSPLQLRYVIRFNMIFHFFLNYQLFFLKNTSMHTRINFLRN